MHAEKGEADRCPTPKKRDHEKKRRACAFLMSAASDKTMVQSATPIPEEKTVPATSDVVEEEDSDDTVEIVPPPVAGDGVAMRGSLTKKCRWPVTEASYEFFLFDDVRNKLHMLSYASRDEETGALKVHNKIPAEEILRVEELGEKPNEGKYPFRIVNTVKPLDVWATDSAVRDQWVKALQGFILRAKERAITKQRKEELKDEKTRLRSVNERVAKEKNRRKVEQQQFKRPKEPRVPGRGHRRNDSTNVTVGSTNDAAAIAIQKITRGHQARKRLDTVIEVRRVRLHEEQVASSGTADAVMRMSSMLPDAMLTTLRRSIHERPDMAKAGDRSRMSVFDAEEVAEAEDAKESNDDFLDLHSGGLLMKYHAFSLPKRRSVFVRGHAIYWAEGTTDKGWLDLHTITHIDVGKKTSTLFGGDVADEVCFSLVAPERRLDLSCRSQKERDRWVTSLELAIQKARQAHDAETRQYRRDKSGASTTSSGTSSSQSQPDQP